MRVFPARFTGLCVIFVVVRNATQRIPEHLRERFKFHIQQLPKVVQEILKYVSCYALQHSYSIHLSRSQVPCTLISGRMNYYSFYSVSSCTVTRILFLLRPELLFALFCHELLALANLDL